MSKIVYDADILQVFGGNVPAGGKTAVKGGLLEDARKNQLLSGVGLGISALANMGASYSGYLQSATKADYLRLQAEQTGLRAEQTANQLREKLYGQISNSFAGYAARGVDVGSGSPIRQAELTAKEGGTDLQQLQENAKLAADAYNAQADILKRGSTLEMFSGMANALAQSFMSAGMIFG